MAMKPSFADSDFTKMFKDFKIPGIDFTTLAAAQRRNLEALVAANKLALEGAQAIGRRQAEIIRQTIEETVAAAQSVLDKSPPEERAVKQTELAKLAFEKSLNNMHELAELIAKSNREAFDVINKRVAELLDELKAAIVKHTPTK